MLMKSTCAPAPSGLSTLIRDHLAGGASRLAALLLPQILPVFSVVAPCHPGAALRDLVPVQRGQTTSLWAREPWVKSGLRSLSASRVERRRNRLPRGCG